VFSKDRRINVLLSIMFLALAACGGVGAGCGGCGSMPLPAGGLPKTQTVEGGGQVRVTRAGFAKLTQIIPGFLNDSLGGGFCVGQQDLGIANACTGNSGPTCNPGCFVDVNIPNNGVVVSVTNQNTMNVKITTNVRSSVRLSNSVFGSCTMTITANRLYADLDIGFGINATTGALQINLRQINDTDLSGVNFSGCSILSGLANLVVDLMDSFLGDFIIDLLTPTINDLIQGFLPDPLGIEGMVDIGAMMSGVSPGTEGFMEARMIPGGYVQLQGGGMSLGLITGLNADRDPATRGAGLISEPAFCVPPIPAPNFAAPPASLPASSRGTFTLRPASEFLGMPEPGDDLAIGLSETTLDLAGHHLVTSGGMCLGVGTSLISQLKLGTIGLLVPSLGELGTGDEPLLLVTRPQKALDFSIGDGTEASPSIGIAIKGFEVDFYAFIYERYVRAFTMSLDMNVGVNLEFEQLPGQPATVKPILVGLTADQIHITVLNNEFVKETQAELEAVLPTIFNLALPLITGGLDPIPVPSFAGFTLNNLRVQKVRTTEDEFLAIYASLGVSAKLRQDASTRFPSLLPVVADLDQKAGLTQWPRRVSSPTATLRTVMVPKPDQIRAALAGFPGTSLPTVTIDVATHDDQGRPLEWSWSLDHGMSRPYTTASPLVIADKAFAWQGKYTIGLQSRVVGDYRTTSSETVEIPVVIDSAGPKIRADEARWDGNDFRVPATDAVYGHDELQWAYGVPGDDVPGTDWVATSALDRQAVKDLSLDEQIQVFVRDPSGNVSTAIAKTGFHGAPSEGGCSCDASGTPPVGTLIVFLLAGVALLLPRRRPVFTVRAMAAARRIARSRYLPMVAVWAGVSIAVSMVPACSCGSQPGAQSCEVVEDCDLQCPTGEIALCFDNECICTDDVPYGKIGTHSDVAVAPNGDAVVSGYAQNHGDLVVARHPGQGRIPNEEWEFVDGVPDGPVALPDSTVRGGILEPGPDVGLYTSVAVSADDTIMVSYYDRDQGALKFAFKPAGGVWTSHIVDEGTGGVIDPELGGEQAGLYTAITLRSDDGRPGIAYLARVSQGGGIETAEVRYVSAQSATPTTASDWLTFTVDSMTLPPVDPAAPDVYPLPAGIGLFVEATRDANNAPVIAYYDRENGDLKIAKFNAGNGQFNTPTVMAGANADSGWYPSVAVDAAGVVHTAYQGADHDDVFYKSSTGPQELVDDGYRIVGTTPEGLPKPEFHFVGSDTQIVMTGGGPLVAYQDSTTHELLVADKSGTMGAWRPNALAGNEMDWAGAYGFYASAALGINDVTLSTWVLNQQLNDSWVEIFRIPVSPP